MNAPLAVSPSTDLPGLYLTVDLLSGASSPGTAGLRALIMGPKNDTGGDITEDTEIREAVSGPDAVRTAAGVGSLPHLCSKALFANDPQALVDVVCPTKSGGSAAAGTITMAGTLTADGTIKIWTHGVRIRDVAWLVGETPDDAVTKVVAAVNEKADDIFVIASDAVSAGVVDVDARGAGPAGNDVRLRVELVGGTGGTAVAGAAKLSGGTTEPDFTTALSTVAGREYDYIVPCISNAEAEHASAGNHVKVETHIDGLKTGLNAKLQQAVYASTTTIAAAKTGAIGRNSTIIEHVCVVNGESLPCEWAGAEAGDRMRRRRLESNANRIGTTLKRVVGSADKVADNPTEPEGEDALDNGVSIVGYTPNGDHVLLRSITSHSQDSGGNPDKRAFDTNEVDGLYDVGKDLRAALPQEFKQVKIVKDRTATDKELPPNVVEERDVRSFLASRVIGFWADVRGVVDGEIFQAAVDDGSFIVEVNASDATQVDIFMPLEVIKILAKFGLYMAKTG